MKARVIKTTYYSPINEGGVVEIVPNMEADAADVYNAPVGKCFLCKCPDGKLIYVAATCLQIIEEGANSDDYWTRLEHQAAIAAMQGALANFDLLFSLCKDRGDCPVKVVAIEFANACAHAFVEKMKEERK